MSEGKEKRSAGSEELLRAVIESTADGILVVGKDGKVLSSNRRFADLWQDPKTGMHHALAILPRQQAATALRQEIDRILKKLEGFGVIFCQTDQLHATFQNIISGQTKTQSPMPSNAAASEKGKSPTVKLITAKVIHAAVDNKQNAIRLASGGMITPLARDLAKEYSIQIIKTNE